jgi:hypothetical protein
LVGARPIDIICLLSGKLLSFNGPLRNSTELKP